MSSKYSPSKYSPSKKCSDSRGVLFLNQFPKNFLRHYGKVEGPPTTDVVLKRIKPDSCEWLRRPNVAMSELSENLTTNMELLDQMRTEGSLLSKKGVRLYKEALEPLLESVSKLNNKSECKGGSEDVKNVLKFLVGTEEETDNLIDEAFQAGAALFLTATHLTVARTLFRNCEQYAGAIEASNGSDEEFKKGQTARELKTMLCRHFETKVPQASPSKMSQKKRLLKLLLSDSEEDSESETEQGESSELIDVSEKGKGTKCQMCLFSS